MKRRRLTIICVAILLLLTSLSMIDTAKVEIKNAFGDVFTNSNDARLQYLEKAREFYFKDQTDTIPSLHYYYSGEEELDQELDAKYARITEPLKDAESRPIKDSDLKDRLPSLMQSINISYLYSVKNKIPLYYECVYYQTKEELDLIKWSEETGEDYCLEGDAPIMAIKVAPQNRKFLWHNKYFLQGGLAAAETRQEEIDYNYLMEYFCQNRVSIDYYGLYKWNRGLLHSSLEKWEYDFKYKSIVDKLLLAASNIYECDVERTLDIMHTTAKVMIEQEKKLLEVTEEHSIFGTPFHDYALLKALKPYTNAGHLWQFYPYVEEELLGEDNYMNYVQNEREWSSNSAFVWCYSFWLRRYFEGNDHNIYNTLRAIQKDYERMEDKE